MKPHTASLLNAIVLLAMSAWGYLGSDTPSVTALIPGVFGLALLGCHSGVKNENKVVAHIAVGLTGLLFLSLLMPLKGAIGRGDGIAVLRVVVMLVATALALASFIRAFVAARGARFS